MKLIKDQNNQIFVTWEEVAGAASYTLKLCNAETPEIYVDTEVQTPEYTCDFSEIEEEAVRVIMSATDSDGVELASFNEVMAVAIATAAASATSTVCNPFSLNFNANESVTLNTGAAVFKTNILTLPGRGGFDFSLDLRYDSSEADIRKPVRIHWPNITDRHRWYDLGVGWRFDLPHIYDHVLYLPGKGSFEIFGHSFVDRSLQDMWLSSSSFVSGNLRASIVLGLHDGTTYHFHHQLIIGIVDRFGNTIRFEYEAATNEFAWRRLTRITDSNGRVINFERAGTNRRDIVITSPDGGRYTINMAQIPGHSEYQVTAVQNQVNATTTFAYRTAEARFNFSSKTPTHHNHMLLLEEVRYPSNARLRFAYTATTINMGAEGSRQTHRVTRRHLLNDGSSTAVQNTTFSYLRDATGFPSTLGIVPLSHTYATTVTQNNGVRTEYTFNNHHLNTLQQTFDNNNLIQTQTTTYDHRYRLPIRIISEERRNGRIRSTTKNFTYNRYGQVLTAPSPHNRHTLTYVYDRRFGMLLSKTSQIIREVNVLSTDGRSIISTNIYENNKRMSRTDYIRDTSGNATEIREFPDAGDSRYTATRLTYSSDTLPTVISITNIRDVDGNPIGEPTERRLSYDSMWRTISETDPAGNVTEWQYDALGRVTRVTLPNGGFEAYTYNNTQNTVTHRTALDVQYVYSYNSLGKLLRVTAPDGTVIQSNAYDNRMRMTDTRNAQGISSSSRTIFTYDSLDRETERQSLRNNTVMQRVTTTYADIFDAAGNARITKTIRGNANAPDIQTFIQYDNTGLKTQEGTVDGKTVTYTYDVNERVIREQSPGVDNTFTRNIFGIATIRNIEGNTARSFYDGMGRMVCTSDYMGNFTTFRYDSLGRVIRRDTPFERTGNTTHSASTRYSYDPNGNITQTDVLTSLPGQQQAWSTTTNSYCHNMLTSSNTGGVTTNYTYNLAGNVLTKHVGAAVTTYTYDNRGRLIRETDALGLRENYTYDANSLPLTMTDRNGVVFTREYDAMGRLIIETARRNNEIVGRKSYTYTPTGSLRNAAVNIGSSGHSIEYAYDAQGRLRQQTETGGITKTYAYNAADNLTSTQVAIDGRTHVHNVYEYNAAQRLSAVRWDNTAITYAYNANGSLTNEWQDGIMRTTYAYNAANLVTHMTNVNLSTFDYSYHLDGNTQRVTDTRGGGTRTTTYTYDAARRLTQEADVSTIPQVPSITRSYSYDNRNNRTSMVVTGAENHTVNYTYDLNNRMLTEAGRPFTYDNNGNQITAVVNGATETRRYNAYNQLIASTFGGADYFYRADGLRHVKAAPGTLGHIWDGENVVLELDGGRGGSIRGRYNRTPNGKLISSPQNGRYIYNARGDIVQRVDNNGNVVSNYHYTAFGMEAAPSTNNANPFRHNGEYWDAHRDEYYLRARSYNPRTGRFTQADTFWGIHNMQRSPLAILQAANLYVYTMNNPIRWVDPWGLAARPSASSGRIYVMGADGVARPLDLSRPVYITDGHTTVQRDPTQSVTITAGHTTVTHPNMVVGSHAAHTPFFSLDIAILAWGNTFNPQTTRHVSWYSWLLEHRNTGMFTFGTAVNTGAAMMAQRHASYTRVGAVHTHPSIMGMDSFTGRYIDPQTGRYAGDGLFARTSRVPIFLIRSGGGVRRLDQYWQDGTYLYTFGIMRGRIRNDSPHVTVMPWTTTRR